MTPTATIAPPAAPAARPDNPNAFTDHDWAVIAESLRITADTMDKIDGVAALDAIVDVTVIRLKVLGKLPVEAGQ